MYRYRYRYGSLSALSLIMIKLKLKACRTIWAFITLCLLQAYSARNLKGLTVEHSSEMIKASNKILTQRQVRERTRFKTQILNFQEGKDLVLTLKDSGLLAQSIFDTICMYKMCGLIQLCSQTVDKLCSRCLFLVSTLIKTCYNMNVEETKL